MGLFDWLFRRRATKQNSGLPTEVKPTQPTPTRKSWALRAICPMLPLEPSSSLWGCSLSSSHAYATEFGHPRAVTLHEANKPTGGYPDSAALHREASVATFAQRKKRIDRKRPRG